MNKSKLISLYRLFQNANRELIDLVNECTTKTKKEIKFTLMEKSGEIIKEEIVAMGSEIPLLWRTNLSDMFKNLSKAKTDILKIKVDGEDLQDIEMSDFYTQHLDTIFFELYHYKDLWEEQKNDEQSKQ